MNRCFNSEQENVSHFLILFPPFRMSTKGFKKCNWSDLETTVHHSLLSFVRRWFDLEDWSLFILYILYFQILIVSRKKVNRWIVNRRFNSERRHFSFFSFYFHPSGNKPKYSVRMPWLEFKSTIQYSPIHFSGYKMKVDNVSLVGVKTPIHLFTYSLFTVHYP